jgi:putative membrane protein
MRRLNCILATALAMALPFSVSIAMASPQEAAPTSAAPIADQDFIKKAMADGISEVKVGQLAISKASSPHVKSFAEQLVSDHTKANEELASLANQKHVATMADPAASTGTLDHLRSLNGSAFDQAYVSTMVDAHKKAIALFVDASHSSDPDIRAYVLKVLPTLKQHLHMAEALMASHP